MKNRKPNNRSGADTPNKGKGKIADRVEKSQNPPEIIVLPDNMLPDKPNIKPTKPVETPSEDKPSGEEKPSDKK